MIPINFPELKQVPDCKMEFSSFKIREYVSDIEASKLESAVTYD